MNNIKLSFCGWCEKCFHLPIEKEKIKYSSEKQDIKYIEKGICSQFDIEIYIMDYGCKYYSEKEK